MNKALYLFAGVALALGMQSCENASSLASGLEGSWAGVPERLFDSQASSGTIIETFTFTPIDTVDNGGRVVITALTSVTGAVNGVTGISEPVSVTASGSVSVAGTWEAVSADRVMLNLDMKSLKVKVDPDAVVMNADVLTGESAPASITVLRPQLAGSISQQLQKAVSDRYADMSQMDGVSLKNDGNTLRFKINKSSYTLTRQPD